MSIQTDDFGTPPPARMVDAKPETPQEEAIERALRPKLLDDYVGQAKVREQLEIFIGAAKMRGEPLDHVLLFGPPGLGKTTLSHIIAAELGVNLRQTSGPVLEKPKDLAALLTNLEKNDVEDVFKSGLSFLDYDYYKMQHNDDIIDLVRDKITDWHFGFEIKDPLYEEEVEIVSKPIEKKVATKKKATTKKSKK